MSTNSVSVNYYSVLGVARDASTKEINVAFKRLALRLHPDKSGGDRAAIEQFHRVRCDLKTYVHFTNLTQEAVETLRDPERRRRHDEALPKDSFTVNNNGEGHFRRPKAYKAPYNHRESEWNNQSERSATKQQHVNRRDMWGPHIYTYNARAARPFFKVPKLSKSAGEGEGEDQPEAQSAGIETATQEPRTRQRSQEKQQAKSDEGEGEGEDRLKAQSAGIGPEAQKAHVRQKSEEEQQVKQEKEDMETVKEDETSRSDTKSDGISDTDGDSVYHDTTEYNSMPGSFHDHHCDCRAHASLTSGSVEGSSVDGGVLLPDQYQTGDDDTIHTMYYDCSEHPEPVSSDDRASLTEEENTDDESEVADEQPDIAGALRPFIPHLVNKLRDSSGRYTPDHLCAELNGLVMEAFRGWLEERRCSFPNAEASTSLGSGSTGACSHPGLWEKSFDHLECEICHLWKPIYVLTCSGCGAKACVRCKFSDGGKGTGGMAEW